MYPVFLKLQGRRVLLVGGGKVAAGKLEGLLAAGAQVTVVAPEIRSELEQPGVTCVRREFEDADLDGAWYVVAAAPPEVNRRVGAAAEQRRVFVNAVDDPAHASAYLGGVVRRAGVTIAISTGGRAPALAGLLREALEAMLPGDFERWMERADEVRSAWRRDKTPMSERRPRLLEVLNELYEKSGQKPLLNLEYRAHRSSRSWVLVPVIRSSGPSARCAGSPTPIWCCTTRWSMPSRCERSRLPSAFQSGSGRA